jgi:two-component system sensor histidine kinase/response regulator
MEERSLNTEPQTARQLLLVIDDDDINREVIAKKLETKGYQIITADNGLDGLGAAKLHKPDLIICDINMPKMNGHELLSIVKTDPECSSIPFIFLTSNKEPGDVRKGMRLGADDYLAKSLTMDELYAAVETRLNKRKLLQKYYETQFDDIKTSIISFLPHEFRTPLNSILGFSELLHESSGLPEEEIKNISLVINRSASRLEHLLENLILFGQLQFWMNDAEKIDKIRKESETIVSDIFQSVAERQMVNHDRAGAVRLLAQNNMLRISSIHLTKIMEEIVDNALKFSPVGSVVTIGSTETEMEYQVIVRDEGRGLNQDQLRKISAFQQFERNYYEQQGAGLGLAITKTLTEIYGGSFSIESEEKKGTTVRITLLKAKN